MTIATLIAYLIAVAIPAFAVYLMFTQDLFGTGKRSTVLVALGSYRSIWPGLHIEHCPHAIARRRV
jgi:hypothetical protein